MRRSTDDLNFEPTSVTRFRRLLSSAAIFGLWALLPPYAGPLLYTARRVEIADHVIPGMVVLIVVAAAFLATRRATLAATVLLAAGLVVSLAGLWMTSTHVPLVVQSIRQQVPWAATIHHTAPGLAVLGVGLFWVRSYWAEAA